MARPTGQLEKALSELTIAVKQDADERRLALRDSYTGEHFQQVHLGVSGLATKIWGYADRDVVFELPFLAAPAQRQVPFAVPHFNYGIEHITSPRDLVLINAHVLAWRITEENWIVGARMRIAAQAPNFIPPAPILTLAEIGPTGLPPIMGAASTSPADLDGVPFNITAHLTFQGFATYAEGEEFDS